MDDKPVGVDALRAIAEAMFRVRAGLEHADIEGARLAARNLLNALEALPTDRAEYEKLCEEADKVIAVDRGAWNEPTGA